jgi:hypothetical protein
MVSSQAQTVRQYLDALPSDRRAIVTRVRKLIRDHLPAGFQEGMQYGMISYYVPLSRFPDTYNGQPLAIISLAAQKNHLSLYLMGLYGDADGERRFAQAFHDAGKKLDMGKSCLRFKRFDDLAQDALEQLIAGTSVEQFIARYRDSRHGNSERKAGPEPAAPNRRSAAPKKTRSGKGSEKAKTG